MITALLVLAWIVGSIFIGAFFARRWTTTGLGRKYPDEAEYELETDFRCSCPLALNAARILNDAEYACINPADGEDGLCSSCRARCLRIVEVVQKDG